MGETCRDFTPLNGDWEKNVKNRGPVFSAQNLFGIDSHLPQKTKESQKTNVSFCLNTFTMAEDPKADVVGEKPCSPATYEASGLIELVKEREKEAIKAKEELFQPATMQP